MNKPRLTESERKENKRLSCIRYHEKHKDDPAYKKRKNDNRLKWERENPIKYKECMKRANANRTK